MRFPPGEARMFATRLRSTRSLPTQGETSRKADDGRALHRLDDVEEQTGSLEAHADTEERREEFPWGEEVLEDVRDKVGKGACGWLNALEDEGGER